MGLQDLNEELYKRNGVNRDDMRSNMFDVHKVAAQDTVSKDAFQQHVGWNLKQEPFTIRHRQSIQRGLIAFGCIVAIALVYFVVVRIQQSAFSSDHVTMTIDGPAGVSGSETSLFVFTYVNANRSDLTNVELDLSYPENFQPEALENMSINGSSSQVHINTIAGHSQGKIEIHGKFSGSKGSLAYIKGVLRYKPASVGSFFQTESQIGITIQSPSIKLSMEAPLEVASGGLVEYRVDYTNSSDVTFDHLRLQTDYPAGFHLQEATPKASEGDAIWYVGNLAPGQTGSVRIVGTMDGAKDEVKILKAHIGMLQGDGTLLSYSDSDRLTKIIVSPLVVQQTVSGLDKLNANPGDVLRYDVHYRNDGAIGLRNVIITLEIVGDALDFSRLQPDSGSFDSTRKMITWKASDVRDLANLAPGKEGMLSVSVPILNNIPVKTATDKNFVITSVAKIDSPDIATPTGSNKIIGSNTLRVKVNSGLNVLATAAYQDATIPNAGPVPPQIGQETTYTMHWSVTNTTNDADQAIVTAYLPTGMRWTGKFSPTSENITYNDRTNQITWNLGNIQSGTGSVRQTREVLFQVGLTPQVNQSGQLTPILGETTLTAHDLFTDDSLQSKAATQTVLIAQ